MKEQIDIEAKESVYRVYKKRGKTGVFFRKIWNLSI